MFDDSTAGMLMVEEKRGRGRPKGKGPGRMTDRYAVMITPEYRAWMEAFMAHIGEVEVSDVYREAVRQYAAAKGFREPPKR